MEKEEQAGMLCSLHFMLEAEDAVLHQEALHRNTLLGTSRGGTKGQKAVISCQAAFQETVNLWDHDASSSQMCFITHWRTIQAILYEMFVFSFLAPVTRVGWRRRQTYRIYVLSASGGR